MKLFTRILLPGALAAALAVPAMAQGFEFRFDGRRAKADVRFGRTYGSGHFGSRFGGHSRSHERVSLRFDPASPTVQAGETLHLHVDLLRGGRVERLLPSALFASLAHTPGRASLIADGDGFRFVASQPGRYIARFSHRSSLASHGASATLAIDVRAPRHRPVRLRLLSGGRELGDALALTPGSRLPLAVEALDAHGHVIGAVASIGVEASARGAVEVQRTGPASALLIAGHGDPRVRHTLHIEAGGLHRDLSLRLERRAPIAQIKLLQSGSCGELVVGSALFIPRGGSVDLRAIGRTRLGREQGFDARFSIDCGLSRLEVRGQRAKLTVGPRRDRLTLTVTDAASGARTQIAVIVH